VRPKAEREDGYYWVKWERQWMVAYWFLGGWCSPIHLSEMLDEDFQEIRPERLIPPQA